MLSSIFISYSKLFYKGQKRQNKKIIHKVAFGVKRFYKYYRNGIEKEEVCHQKI